MKKALLVFLFLSSYLGYSQTVSGNFQNASFQSHDGFYYLYSLESNKIFHICKYNESLEPVGVYERKLKDKVHDGVYSVSFRDSEIEVQFQTGKLGMGVRPKPVPGFKLVIDYDLKETGAEELRSCAVNLYSGAKYRKYNFSNDEYNSFKPEDFESEVKQKNGLKKVGPMISVQNDNKIETFQIANFKDDESDRSYNGFYVLTEKEGKATRFQKYDFFKFEGFSKEESAFMYFYPDLVINTKKSFLIPFAQKVKRVEKMNRGGSSGTVWDIDVYYIIGTGVIEVNKSDGTMEAKFFDRKGVNKKLKEENIVGFEGKNKDDYCMLVRNWPSLLNVFKNMCWSFYDQKGERFQDCADGNIYEFTKLDYYIKFELKKDGYSLRKEGYK